MLNEVGRASSNGAGDLLLVETEPFNQRVLYRWDDRNSRPADVLREVILASKEMPSGEMMRLWASEFYRRAMIGKLLGARRNWVLIPPPGRSGFGEPDHAGALAEMLSTMSGGSLWFEGDAFERVGKSRREKSQKEKSRAERAAIAFRVSESAKHRFPRAAGFIFIDDVIATGATARAAWIALGKPRAFESWAIAFKVPENSLALPEVQNDLIETTFSAESGRPPVSLR